MRGHKANDRWLPSPSSNRTCGFPASGFRMALDSEHSSRPTWLPNAASLCDRGMFAVVGFLQSAPRPSESALPCQGPLAPRALPRFIATMGLSDSPAPGARLMDSAHASPRSSRGWRRGSPSLPNQTFPARCPHRPRRTPPLRVNVASRRVAGFGISERLAVLTLRNEAATGLLALRLAGSIHGASTPRSLASPSASLHAGRSVRMMNSFHFIGLVWRCWRTRDAERQRRGEAGDTKERSPKHRSPSG